MDKLTATEYKKMKKRKRRSGEKRFKERLMDMVKNINPFTTSAKAYDKEHFWTSDPDKAVFYRKVWRAKNRSKFLKKQNNENVRKSDEEELYQHGTYKKLGDFWWGYW